MKLYKAYVISALASLIYSLPLWGFEISLGNDEKSLGIKVKHEYDEPFGKPLPWGPASLRFAGSSLWAADTLKNRIVEFDNNGVYKSSVTINMPKGSTIGDFCFGLFGEKKERAVIVCDADNPSVYAFDQSGAMLGQIGSDTVDVFIRPHRIEVYENKFYILDSGKKEIIELDSTFKVGKRIKTFAENFAIENKYLVHCISNGRNNFVEWHDLQSGESNVVKPGMPSDIEYDFITCNQNKNKGIFIGNVEFTEGENPQYKIIKYTNKEDSIASIYTSYPVSFMVRSFIKDKEERLYQIKFEEDHPEKLIIDEVPQNFDESEG